MIFIINYSFFVQSIRECASHCFCNHHCKFVAYSVSLRGTVCRLHGNKPSHPSLNETSQICKSKLETLYKKYYPKKKNTFTWIFNLLYIAFLFSHILLIKKSKFLRLFWPNKKETLYI